MLSQPRIICCPLGNRIGLLPRVKVPRPPVPESGYNAFGKFLWILCRPAVVASRCVKYRWCLWMILFPLSNSFLVLLSLSYPWLYWLSVSGLILVSHEALFLCTLFGLLNYFVLVPESMWAVAMVQFLLFQCHVFSILTFAHGFIFPELHYLRDVIAEVSTVSCPLV